MQTHLIVYKSFEEIKADIISNIQTINSNINIIDSEHNITKSTKLINETNLLVDDTTKLFVNLDGLRDKQQKLVKVKLLKSYEQSMQEFKKIVNKSKSYDYQVESVTDCYLEPDGQLQQQSLLKEIDNESKFNENIIAYRESAIREIEQNITDVNDMFMDVASLVQDQGIIVDNLEMHVNNTLINVSHGVDELQSAEKYQESARNKTCFLLVFLAIIIFVVIIVLSVIIIFGITLIKINL